MYLNISEKIQISLKVVFGIMMYVDHKALIGYFSDKNELIKPEPTHTIPPVHGISEVSDSGGKKKKNK